MMSTVLQVGFSLYLCPGYLSLTPSPGVSYSPFELQFKYHFLREAFPDYHSFPK